MTIEQARSRLEACRMVAFLHPIQFAGSPPRIHRIDPFEATPEMLDPAFYQFFDPTKVRRMGLDPERSLIINAPKYWAQYTTRYLVVLPLDPSEPLLARCKHEAVLPDMGKTWAPGNSSAPIEDAEYEIVEPTRSLKRKSLNRKSIHSSR